MVSHYDCAKQHNLRQFTLLNVKQYTEAPSNIQHTSVEARVYVRAKAKRIKAYKCVAYAKKERKICFQGSVRYQRDDRTVWNHNTMPLPVTLDPLECKNIIRHPNGTNNKILNNLHYNKTSTVLEDHYFQERLEQFQPFFTVYKLNKMHTGTFNFMPAVNFQGLNPHPIFHVSRREHKTSPALFEVVHNEFERDLNLPTITWQNHLL